MIILAHTAVTALCQGHRLLSGLAAVEVDDPAQRARVPALRMVATSLERLRRHRRLGRGHREVLAVRWALGKEAGPAGAGIGTVGPRWESIRPADRPKRRAP